MKKSIPKLILIVLVVSALALVGCRGEEPAPDDTEVEVRAPFQTSAYEDADYRGIFKDGGDQQVNIQFTLEDNIITDASYRHLYYGGTDYQELEEGDALYGVTEQYEQVLDYLEGKDVRDSLHALYEPGDVIEDVDGFSGATLRANKVISAVRDALNRGAYRY
ncbi:FMN-binding protein [Fuchsiella alkaliacetigena]|uniref:FMN-binding protein n=1 Tax=Fuchsiella alkaliacetigena TaxID=957042 RepID=UPI00200B484A|nr:FMN-binding protein [Fuchsiella alkaliacetigena]MCK8825625.1 FMN-binding protein [Fuchsiella alkaliacetigena]